MNYYFDTEFIEGSQKETFLGMPVGLSKPTIDLISIGIVGEDGREYYGISKDFNLDEAWNRFDMVKKNRFQTDGSTYEVKVYWIRANVLKPIFWELSKICLSETDADYNEHFMTRCKAQTFTKGNLKWLLNKYGKSNKKIANEVKGFCSERKITLDKPSTKPVFYAYYASYDWVVFCWLFGNMMSLPDGFPKYCIDLKQISDELYITQKEIFEERKKEERISGGFLNSLSEHLDYPKQENEHNALDDAKWNKKLHEFIKSI